jgi:TPP-dependent 2-oxoacid decarboxylase
LHNAEYFESHITFTQTQEMKQMKAQFVNETGARTNPLTHDEMMEQLTKAYAEEEVVETDTGYEVVQKNGKVVTTWTIAVQ